MSEAVARQWKPRTPEQREQRLRPHADATPRRRHLVVPGLRHGIRKGEEMSAQDIAELAEQVDNAVRETLRIPALDAARSAANEAGLGRSRANLEAAAKRYEETLAPYREAQAAERRTKESLDAALAEAEWTLNAKLVTKSNKRHLVVDGEEKALTADEVKQWKASEAHKLPAVSYAREAHVLAVREREDRADAVALAERYFTAARLEVEASIAQLAALTTALRSTP